MGQNGREGISLDEDRCAGGSQETRACTTTDCPEVIQDLVNIELNKKRLTIGLKVMERNSESTKEDLKHKEIDTTADSRDPLITEKSKNDKKNKFKVGDADMKERVVAKENKEFQSLEVTNDSKETVVENK